VTNNSNDKPHSETDGKRLLENAYQLETPDDNINYYSQTANSYDEDFARGLGYVLPQLVAKKFSELATAADSPVVDIGCGTGLIAEQLRALNIVIDGMDISNAMLEQSMQTKAYRELYEVDLTQVNNQYNERYKAVLSSGTFTHGHLGPDALVRLLNMAVSGALFIVAINQRHYEEKGFADAVQSLEKQQQIMDKAIEQVAIYERDDHEHSDDMALILSFRKNG